MSKVTLKIEFPSQKHLDHFTAWLCDGGGEQDFWMGGEENSVTFIYHHPQDERFPSNDKRRYAKSKFCRDNTILTEPMSGKDWGSK
jgi:hypothetical protein